MRADNKETQSPERVETAVLKKMDKANQTLQFKYVRRSQMNAAFLDNCKKASFSIFRRHVSYFSQRKDILCTLKTIRAFLFRFSCLLELRKQIHLNLKTQQRSSLWNCSSPSKVSHEYPATLHETIEQTAGTMSVAPKTIATAALEDQKNYKLTRLATLLENPELDFSFTQSQSKIDLSIQTSFNN